MRLSGATVTRIRQELATLHTKMSMQRAAVEDPHVSYGDHHRAIEDFVTELMSILMPGVELVSPGSPVERRVNHRHTGKLGEIEDATYEACRENGIGAMTGTMGEDA